MPYHDVEIPKGEYGELSKVQEELLEAMDADKRGQDLMLLIELSDLVGAVGGVAEKRFGFSLEQLVKFAKLRSSVAREEMCNDVQSE